MISILEKGALICNLFSVKSFTNSVPDLEGADVGASVGCIKSVTAADYSVSFQAVDCSSIATTATYVGKLPGNFQMLISSFYSPKKVVHYNVYCL